MSLNFDVDNTFQKLILNNSTTYVNGQVGISIKLSDVHSIAHEDKLPNPIGFPYIFFFSFCSGRLFDQRL